jgi:hypothetical protein
MTTALTSSPGWRWMPGMRVQRVSDDTLYRIVIVAPSTIWDTVALLIADDYDDAYAVTTEEIVGECLLRNPDLTDPATIGCLAALARELYKSPTAHAVHMDGTWWISDEDDVFDDHSDYPTECEAWAALITAWRSA